MKKVIPCCFTSGNLIFGFISIVLTAQGNFFWGGVCILLATLCDACDGRSARYLGVSGEFGKELDSLSDCVSFGAASAFLIYSYALQDLGWIGVVPAALYAALGGLRLARFNLNTTVVHGYFMGMPIPNGGCLFATFVMSGVHISPVLAAIIVLLVGYDLVSEIHHPDFKGQSADVLHVPALVEALVLGAAALYFVDWRLVICMPFALYIVFGLVNTAMNAVSPAR